MDGIIVKIVDALFSQCGLIGLLLLAALIYQTRELAKERRDRLQERERWTAAASERGRNYDKMADALSNLRITVAQVLERVRP